MLFVPLLQGGKKEKNEDKYNQLYLDGLRLISNLMVVV